MYGKKHIEIALLLSSTMSRPTAKGRSFDGFVLVDFRAGASTLVPRRASAPSLTRGSSWSPSMTKIAGFCPESWPAA